MEQVWKHGRQRSGAVTAGNPVPLLFDNVNYAVLSMGRNYAFGRFYWLFHHDELEAEVLLLTALRDGSTLLRPGIYWKST